MARAADGGTQPAFAPDPQAARASTNVMDVWIQASLQVRERDKGGG